MSSPGLCEAIDSYIRIVETTTGPTEEAIGHMAGPLQDLNRCVRRTLAAMSGVAQISRRTARMRWEVQSEALSDAIVTWSGEVNIDIRSARGSKQSDQSEGRWRWRRQPDGAWRLVDTDTPLGEWLSASACCHAGSATPIPGGGTVVPRWHVRQRRGWQFYAEVTAQDREFEVVGPGLTVRVPPTAL